MSGELTNDSTVNEALDGSGEVLIQPSDGHSSSLDFMQLRGALAQSLGLTVNAPAPDGTAGNFNAKVAAVEAPAPTAPQPATPAPEYNQVLKV